MLNKTLEHVFRLRKVIIHAVSKLSCRFIQTKVRAVRYVNHHTRKGIAQRHIEKAETSDPAFAPQRFTKRLPQCDAHVFVRVVGVNM